MLQNFSTLSESSKKQLSQKVENEGFTLSFKKHQSEMRELDCDLIQSISLGVV